MMLIRLCTDDTFVRFLTPGRPASLVARERSASRLGRP